MSAPRVRLLGFVAIACGGLLALAVHSCEALAAAWATGVEARLPADAGSNPFVDLSSVSCASAGNCTAVGRYAQGTGLLLTESSGTWATGVDAPLPGNVGGVVYLAAVSCASAGNCSAVGSYSDTASQHPLLLTERSGRWSPGVEAGLPAGAESTAFLSSVSCASAGNCSAVGNYGYYRQERGLLLAESSGRWGMGVEPSLPADAGSSPSVGLSSVSCASAGNCAAVGGYTDSSGHGQGLLLTQSSGTWAPGVEATLPAGARSGFLSSVSCASAGNCTAVGTYLDSAGGQHALLLTQSSGTWGPGLEPSLPAGAGAVDLSSGVRGTPGNQNVSCASAGNCAAVGRYNDSSNHVQGLLLSESSGTWAPGVKATLPANAGSNPFVFLSSVSCATADSCSAVGGYSDTSGAFQGLLLTNLPSSTITGLSQTHPIFRVGPRSTPLFARTTRSFPREDTFSFRLTQPAVVSVRIQRKLPGRRVGRVCKPPTFALRFRPRCTRLVLRATLRRSARMGLNRIVFSGRIRGHALPPGYYRAAFTAANTAGTSALRALNFRIVADYY